MKTLVSKRIEIESNYDALKSLCDQIEEEVNMGREDVAGNTIKLAELVTQREDLEAIYEGSFKQYG